MAPERKFVGKEIEETAFRMLRRDGFKTLTARAIAKELAASTMPIYTAMKSMEDLTQRMRERALALLKDFQTRRYTENPFLNQAIGYVAFARTERNLFRFLYIDQPVPAFEKQDGPHAAADTAGLSRSEWFGPIDENSMDEITLKSFFFVHGLAMALSLGTVGPYNDERIKALLQEAGGAFVLYERQRNAGGSL